MDQTAAPGFDIPNPAQCTVEQLREFVASRSAQMLVAGIRHGIFVPPLEDVGWHRKGHATIQLRHAAKIAPEDRHIKWSRETSQELIRRNRVLGPLWSLCQDEQGQRRLILPYVKDASQNEGTNPEIPVGHPYYHSKRGESGSGIVFANMTGHTSVEIPLIKMEGEKARPGRDVLETSLFSRFGFTTSFHQGGTWRTLQASLS